MKKWSAAVDAQRKYCAADREQSAGTDATDFAWMRDQAIQMPNPYAQQEDDDDDDVPPNSTVYHGQSSFESSRNASSNSLRSRSTTGESTQSLTGMARAPPPRFPMNPPLSVQTQMQGQMPSPSQRGGESYFSPIGESPASSRTSQTSSMFTYSRQGTPQSGWEEHNRYTAPAIARAPSRESQLPPAHYQNGRNPQRPSLPVMSSQNSQPTAAQQRSRSYSTPDINGQNGSVRRLPNGSTVPAVPGIPAHLHSAYDGGIPRSNSNSPSNGLPMRSSTQSPGVQRERLAQHLNAPQYIRSNTTPMPTSVPSSAVDVRTMSPSLANAASSLGDMPLPTQLKVKVNCDGNYVTLVVAFNITYQSLIDRIDAKVGRFSNNAISRGTMRLRYRDEDGDFVTIESDEDIQIAFQEWREAQKSQFHTGQLGEIELFCASVEN
jgi:cell division control protein 24